MEKRKLSKKEICLLVLLSAFILFVLVWSFISDIPKESYEPKSYEIYNYFDTVTFVSDYSGDSESDFMRACALAADSLKYYHELFDIYNEYDGLTNIATLNRLAGEGPVTVSADLFDFLEYALGMYELTGGEVNVAMGSVLSIWHTARDSGERVPSSAELLAASLHCDINSVVLKRADLTVEITDPLLSLDVGAVAKGYAAEKTAEALRAAGFESYVLDVGGNIRTVGTKPNGDGWKIGVRNPDKTAAEAFVYRFELSDGSAVTSGDYERYYVLDGKKYHHIIDKDTLFPSEHFRSVTVITEHSGLADTLSTALFCMDYDSGTALLDTLDGVRAVWVTPDGSVLEYNK